MDEGKKEPEQTKVDDWNEATSGDVVKLKEGAAIEGKLIGIEPSRQFADSFALRIEVDHKPQVVFVSNIVVDLLTANNIHKGQQIKLVFDGMKTSKQSGRQYKDYKLFYK